MERHNSNDGNLVLRLAYTSTAAFDFTDGDLISLLMNSRANNKRDGITGLLLHDAGHFLQFLEGEADAVDEKFAHITMDARHREVSLLSRENVQTRVFGRWSMGYKSLTDPLIRDIPGYNSFFAGGTIPGDAVVSDLLQRFRDEPSFGWTSSVNA